MGHELPNAASYDRWGSQKESVQSTRGGTRHTHPLSHAPCNLERTRCQGSEVRGLKAGDRMVTALVTVLVSI